MKRLLVFFSVLALVAIACGKLGGIVVVDGNSVPLGTMGFYNATEIGIVFSDGVFGRFNPNGAYVNSACSLGLCSGIPQVSGSSLSYDYDGSYIGTYTGNITFTGVSKSYVFFTTSNCSGTAYSAKAPSRNTLFRSGTSSFAKGTGSETATTGLSIASIYFYDYGSCSTLAAGTGVCCSNIVPAVVPGSLTNATGYALTAGYSLPAGVPAYPFTGPLTIK